MRRSLLNKRITPKHLWQLFGLFTMLLLPSATWGETPTSDNYLNWGPSERGIAVNIDKGEVTISAEAQTVTYNAQQQAYTGASADNGNVTFAIAYYTSEEERSKESNALAGAPTDAGTYYVSVTLSAESQQHYTAEAANATFTIAQLDISDADITLDNDELTYNGQVQSVNVTKVMAGNIEVPIDCYEVSGNSGTEVGNYTLIVTAKTMDSRGNPIKNNFTGIAEKAWKINHRTASAEELGFKSETQTTSTYYDPNENLNLPEGYVAYIITGINGNSVTTQRVSYIPKGVAVLVEKGQSSESAIDVVSNPDDLLLKGTQGPKAVSSITGGIVYVLYNGEFVKSTSGTIPAHRGYLLVATNQAALAALLLTTSASAQETAEEFAIIYQLDGQQSSAAAAGTVVGSISGSTATLTVTPAEGNYITKDQITVIKTTLGDNAQSRAAGRAAGISSPLEITASSATADPSGQTTYTFDALDASFNYEVTANFLSRKDVAGASILISQSDYKYDGGKPIEPEISVSFNSEAMTADKDYTVAYSNNTNAGKGTVTITGKGIYKGTLSEEFTIGKAPVEIWFETAAGAEATELETTFGTTFTEPVLKLNPADAIEVTYSVNDESVATIDPSTGKLTILKGGTVVVTAAAKEDYTNKEGSNYKADPSNTKASYSLTINKTTPPTGITFVNSDKQAVMSGWYTIDGQKIAEPTQKGLYIKDGKKIVIR